MVPIYAFGLLEGLVERRSRVLARRPSNGQYAIHLAVRPLTRVPTWKSYCGPDLPLRLACGCGIVLGIDREIRGFAARIRTHALRLHEAVSRT